MKGELLGWSGAQSSSYSASLMSPRKRSGLWRTLSALCKTTDQKALRDSNNNIWQVKSLNCLSKVTQQLSSHLTPSPVFFSSWFTDFFAWFSNTPFHQWKIHSTASLAGILPDSTLWPSIMGNSSFHKVEHQHVSLFCQRIFEQIHRQYLCPDGDFFCSPKWS